MQGESDTPEALASIPHLSLSDISIKSKIIPRSHEDLCGVPALCHDIFTNGISYINLAFPVDTLLPEDYLWLPFFAGAIFSVGLPGMDYTEVSSLLARTVGDLNVNLFAGSVAPTANDNPLIKVLSGEFDLAGRDWIIYSLKCLDEKTAPSLDIVQRLLNEADFTDHKRIKNLVLEMKNDVRSSLAPLGHNYASRRAERFSSPATMTNETWNGITQFLFVHRLAEMDTAEAAAKLEYLRSAITSSGFIANLTGSTEALGANCKFISQRFSGLGSPKRGIRDRGSGIGDKRKGTGDRELGIGDQGSLFGLSRYNSEASLGSELRSPVPSPQSLIPEIFASPSLQIGFAAMALRGAAFDTPAQAAEKVLSHHLSTGSLWETIRMKGGAYGAFASSDSLKRYFSLSTYRDPAPLRSLDSFSAILKDGCSVEKDEIFQENLVKTIIGCYAGRTSPLTPSAKGILDFRRFISCIDDDYHKRNLERIISVSAEDIAAAYRSLASQLESGPIGQVIITGTKDAEQVAKALGTEVQILPV
jgi:Zn-dependent M16 (insulinase) family peptidase